MASAKERQAAFVARFKAAGIKKISVYVPEGQADSVTRACKVLCEHRDLELGGFRSTEDYTMVGRKRVGDWR